MFVLDGDDASALGGQVTAEDQVHGLAAGGPVERLGHRGPPVDDQRDDVVGRHPQTADVEGLDSAVVGPAVDTAETEGLFADVELVDPGQGGPDDDVTLFAELVGATVTLIEDGAEELLGVGPELVQALIGPVDVSLFCLELRMCAQCRSLFQLRAVNHRSYRGGLATPTGPRRAAPVPMSRRGPREVVG